MPNPDRSAVRRGLFITGGNYPAVLTTEAGPVRFGDLPRPGWDKIRARLRDAAAELESIRQAVRRARQ